MKSTVISYNGLQIEYFVNDYMARGCIAINKEWEPHILLLMKALRPKNIIDVGANFGYHTMTFSRELSGHIYSFEPQIQNFGLLDRNVKRNQLKNVTVYNLACSDVSEEVSMPYINNTHNLINMGNFTPNTPHNEAENRQYHTTKAIPLDSMEFPKIDLMKIDVQGYEIKVLNGARKLLKDHKPILFIEIEDISLNQTGSSSIDIVTLLRDLEYDIFYLECDEYPVDHVCVHKSMIDTFTKQFKHLLFDHTIDNEINHNVSLGINKLIRTRLLTRDTTLTSKDDPYRSNHWDHRTGRFISR